MTPDLKPANNRVDVFSASLEIVLTIAYREAVSRRHAYLTLEHLLYALAHDPEGERILQGLRRRPAAAAPRAERLPRRRRSSSCGAARSASRNRRRRSAACCRPRCCTCRARSAPKSTPATSWPRSCSSRSRRRRGSSTRRASRGSTSSSSSRTASPRRRRRSIERRPDRRGAGRRRRRRHRPRRATRSAAYCLNLTERARQGLLDPLIGRADELQRTIEVLCRRRKNNPVFVGEAGVGKTAMAEGLATRLLADDVPEMLAGRGGVLARHRRAARRHAVPRRLRGALQGGHPRARRAAARHPLHRRDPLDRRRRRDHRRHDGSGDDDQADPHGRRSPRHRIDDVRGVQAHREGPGARAPAAEDRDRGAVDRGDRADPERPARRATKNTTA